MAQPDIP